jgi:hypothetical protein
MRISRLILPAVSSGAGSNNKIVAVTIPTEVVAFRI